MLDLAKYQYELPSELIATQPLKDRSKSRLMVYDTATDAVHFDLFENIGAYLPKDSFFVINETKVLPARVLAKKEETGGAVELLFLVNEWDRGQEIGVLSDRKLSLGMILLLADGYRAKVVRQEEKIFYLELLFSATELEKLLLEIGVTPLPKYLGQSQLSEEDLRARYQTVFAKEAGSVAAPTASLHFTPELFADLREKGHPAYPVTLHVGLGTFSPFTPEQLELRELFSEQYFISQTSADAINAAKKEGKELVAVGTTATRTVESAVQAGRCEQLSGSTKLFIVPGYQFQMVDHLVTNFHVPGSSLMLLVDAFLEHKRARRRIGELYAIAIKERMRFFSFGDAMLLL